MGNTTDYPVETPTRSEEVQTQHSYLYSDEEEYFNAYDRIKNPNIFFCILLINQAHFLHECPSFSKNLELLFPNALVSPEEYY